jgi:hypothetical protein
MKGKYKAMEIGIWVFGKRCGGARARACARTNTIGTISLLANRNASATSLQTWDQHVDVRF